MIFGRQKKVAQDRKAALLKHSNEVLTAVENEGRELSEEERKQLDANEADIKVLNSDIARLQRLEDIEKETASAATKNLNVDPDDNGDGKNPTHKAADEAKSLNTAKTKIVLPAHLARAKPKHYESREDAFLSGMWCLAVIYNRPGAKKWCEEHNVPMLAQAEGVNELGGFLVPTPLENAIIDLRETYGIFRQEARVWPMNSDSLIIPRRKSGLTPYFVGENQEITESNKQWDGVELIARKLAVATRYSTELDEDAIINLADDLASEIAYAFALREDQSGFLGDGTSTYGGIVGLVNKIAAGSVYTAVTGNTAFGTLDLADFEAVVGMLPSYAEDGAKWYITKAGFAASMMRLLNATGGNTMSDIAGKTSRQFLGYPVVDARVLNSTLTAQTSTIVAFFGNLKQAATFGNRRGVTIKTSEHRYMEYDQILITGTERFAINVHEVGDATTPGPIIALKTASG